MSGVKGRSGRRRTLAGSQRGRERLAGLLGVSVDVIQKAVEGGDLSVAKWITEMNLGKPPQAIAGVMDVTAQSADSVSSMAQKIMEAAGSLEAATATLNMEDPEEASKKAPALKQKKIPPCRLPRG